jgi:hypothetical protein
MAHAAFVLPGEGASRYRASQQMGPSATPPRSHRHPDLLSSRLEDDPTYFRDLHEDWARGVQHLLHPSMVPSHSSALDRWRASRGISARLSPTRVEAGVQASPRVTSTISSTTLTSTRHVDAAVSVESAPTGRVAAAFGLAKSKRLQHELESLFSGEGSSISVDRALDILNAVEEILDEKDATAVTHERHGRVRLSMPPAAPTHPSPMSTVTAESHVTQTQHTSDAEDIRPRVNRSPSRETSSNGLASGDAQQPVHGITRDGGDDGPSTAVPKLARLPPRPTGTHFAYGAPAPQRPTHDMLARPLRHDPAAEAAAIEAYQLWWGQYQQWYVSQSMSEREHRHRSRSRSQNGRRRASSVSSRDADVEDERALFTSRGGGHDRDVYSHGRSHHRHHHSRTIQEIAREQLRHRDLSSFSPIDDRRHRSPQHDTVKSSAAQFTTPLRSARFVAEAAGSALRALDVGISPLSDDDDDEAPPPSHVRDATPIGRQLLPHRSILATTMASRSRASEVSREYGPRVHEHRTAARKSPPREKNTKHQPPSPQRTPPRWSSGPPGVQAASVASRNSAAKPATARASSSNRDARTYPATAAPLQHRTLGSGTITTRPQHRGSSTHRNTAPRP